ncbi:delta(7)-sterol-C5(6)-desaturase [Pseudoscourfieldia marina]
MAKQIWVSLQAMPLYTALPAVCEAIVERGYTLVYPRVDDFGVGAFVLFFVVYLTSVEFGVYWMHRSLHDVKSAYGLLHKTHHIYNKEHTLSPFAGLAFNPLDGFLFVFVCVCVCLCSCFFLCACVKNTCTYVYVLLLFERMKE